MSVSGMNVSRMRHECVTNARGMCHAFVSVFVPVLRSCPCLCSSEE